VAVSPSPDLIGGPAAETAFPGVGPPPPAAGPGCPGGGGRGGFGPAGFLGGVSGLPPPPAGGLGFELSGMGSGRGGMIKNQNLCFDV